MANIDSIFLRYVDSVNRGQWSQLDHFFHPHFRQNDRRIDLEEYISTLTASGPPTPTITKTVDILVQDDASGCLGARIITKSGEFEYPEHLLCKFQNGKIKDIKSITDMDVLRDRVSNIERSTDSEVTIASAETDLGQMYTSYIACINNQTMATELHKYCHPEVTWCGRQLPLDEYRKLMEDSFSAIQGLAFKIRHLVVDKARQRLAVRIEFSGTPVAKYSGVEPNGKAVAFAEHAFYWIEEGKIRKVSTVIDWETYRERMRE